VYASAAPPSSDHNERYYVPACSSATIATAGMFAHAAFVFQGIGAFAGEAANLKSRALAAWHNYEGVVPKQTHCDSDVVHAGNADWTAEDQNAAAVVAAIYLYAITDRAVFNDYVKQHYRESWMRPYRDIGWTRYQPEQGEALLFYTSLPGADPLVRKAILADKLGDVRAGNQIYGFHAEDDLYRAFMHEPQFQWGSNSQHAQYGNTNLDVIRYRLDEPNNSSYESRALGIVNYFHGVNPLAIVYLSNMYAYGATHSVNEIYHSWFWHDSRWSDALTSPCGPAPGYVPGGPDVTAVASGVPASLSPPAGQPSQKAYRDWNVGYPENSWVVTEPAIYYQAAYVKLLSRFAE
jgi:endoglucanase